MKERKYYTPEIEEFHVGFEFCDKHSNSPEEENNWIKREYTLTAEYELDTINKRINKGLIRIKYLDREDIESLGFFVATTSGMEAAYGKRDDNNELRFILREKYHNNTIEIERILYYNSGKKTIFDGTIKNKSELKKVLKMLGI